MKELVEKLDALYREIDRELRLYSEKANAGDPSAPNHMSHVRELEEAAHATTKALCATNK